MVNECTVTECVQSVYSLVVGDGSNPSRVTQFLVDSEGANISQLVVIYKHRITGYQ